MQITFLGCSESGAETYRREVYTAPIPPITAPPLFTPPRPPLGVTFITAIPIVSFAYWSSKQILIKQETMGCHKPLRKVEL